MRILLNGLSAHTGLVHDADPATLYSAPAQEWLRVNFVASVDGAATGPNGLSGSINNAVDKRVFDHLRATSDVTVGAGTLRAEGCGALDQPLVVVSRRAAVPPQLTGAASGRVIMATWRGADGLGEARELLGDEHIIVTGERDMDLTALRAALAERGFRRQLCEGGPHLFGSMLAAGVVDELDLTLSPKIVGGSGPRITAGAPLDLPARPTLLLEEEGTLLGRWFLWASGGRDALGTAAPARRVSIWFLRILPRPRRRSGVLGRSITRVNNWVSPTGGAWSGQVPLRGVFLGGQG